MCLHRYHDTSDDYRMGNASTSNHDVDDGIVGLPHAILAKAAHIADVRLHALSNNAIPGVELLAAQEAFAPSQMMPDTMASAFTSVWITPS